MRNSPKILLSFDVEEFDLPREYGSEISLDAGIKVSSLGLEKILKLLNRQNVKATFFITGNFANGNPELVQKIRDDGHEIGCHGVDHFNPQKTDIIESKKILEKIIQKKVFGYRQPRMQKNNYNALKENHYLYDSSVNPAFVPGRYNNFNIPRQAYQKEGIIEIPTSVSTIFRIPLFWLALHLFPTWLYLFLAKIELKRAGLLATYFHPWEFTNLKKYPVVPSFIKYNSDEKLVQKLEKTIISLKKQKCIFMTYEEFSRTVAL